MKQSTISWLSVLRRECFRFLSIPRQTILAPLLETFLYIAIFGAALGSRIKEIDGIDYIQFIIPGLLLMAISMNAFSNNAASLAQQKMMHSIDDQLASPVSNRGLMAAYTLGGFIRGSIVATMTLIVSLVMTGMSIAHPVVFVLALGLSGMFFASFGVFVGLRAESFDQLNFYETFILRPLIFLGGIFYSASLLQEPFHSLTKFDPIFYMINSVRYGMLGKSDINVSIALPVIAAATIIFTLINARLFHNGYKLRG